MMTEEAAEVRITIDKVQGGSGSKKRGDTAEITAESCTVSSRKTVW